MNNSAKNILAISVLLSTTNVYGQNSHDNSFVMEVVPDHLAYLYSVQSSSGTEDKLRQLYANNRRWENGRKLRVCFYNGNPVIAKLVRTVASEWNSASGVTFDFGPDSSWLNCLSPRVGFPEIRIGFNDRGYWSYLGSDSERYGGERAPSMNFESLNRIYNEFKYSTGDVLLRADEYHKATIRHEFGHALGLLHEHQNQSLNCHSEIKWSGSGNVYDYFAGPNNFWSKEQVDRNLGFIGATDPDYVAGNADSKSVMMYSLPSSIFKNGSDSKCAVPVNHEISVMDRAIVAKIYPNSNSGQAITLVPESIEDAYIKHAPKFSSERDSLDYLQRTVIDLESDDTATRRNARARLSQIVAENTAIDVVNQLIINVPAGSYRYKLGVSFAISKAGNKVEASAVASDIIASEQKKEKDQLLKRTLKAAQQNLVVE